MITKSTIVSTAVLVSCGIFFSNLPTTKTVVAQSSGSSNLYKLPFPAGKTYTLTQGNGGNFSHTDPYNFHAYDFDMSEGSEVVAARGGTVKSLYEGSNQGGCTAYYKNNWYKFTNYVVIDHGDGTSSLYAHLKSNSVVVNVGDQVSQGQKIAESGKTGHVCGAHLHFSAQETPPGSNYGNGSGGYWQKTKASSFADPDVLRQNPNGIPTAGRSYTSSNGTPSSDSFQRPVSSSASITRQSVNLHLCASNIPSRTVYVQMWRDAAYGYPPQTWNYQQQATSTCMNFLDLDGQYDSFSGVTYYTVASLTPIPDGEAAKKRTSCWSVTGGKYLCDAARR